MFSKVLVPLDGSDVAEVILPYTAQLAKGLDIPLVLISVVERTAGEIDSPFHTSLFETAESEARRRLDRVVDRLRQDGVNADKVLASGRPAEEIVRAVETAACDLIAMTTHGRSPLARGILGSVTDEVVHSAPVPVLTMTPEKAEIYRDHTILISAVIVPLDGSPLAETVLPRVTDLARRLALKILLVRVVSPLHAFWIDHYPVGLAEAEKEIETQAIEYLETIADGLRRDGLEVESQMLTGPSSRRHHRLRQRNAPRHDCAGDSRPKRDDPLGLEQRRGDTCQRHRRPGPDRPTSSQGGLAQVPRIVQRGYQWPVF